MAYTFNPTPGEAALLAQIAQRESAGSGGYIAQNPNSSASGAYQFIDSTWQWVSQQTGVGTQYSSAAAAPPGVQDINALWLLRNYGPNASISWQASAPAGGYDTSLLLPAATGSGPVVDVTGDAAAAPTPSILDQLNVSTASMGIDMSSPTDVAVLAGLGVAAYLLLTIGR